MTGLERLMSLYCIGESHCLRFRDRLFRSPSLPKPLHARTRFLVDMKAADFSGEGGLHPEFAAALVAEGLCAVQELEDGSEQLTVSHRGQTPMERIQAARHAALSDAPLLAPPILIFVGDKDLHSLAMQIGPDSDFELPDDPGYGMLAGARRLPFSTVAAALNRLLRPVAEGLEMLGLAGFTQTFVHGLAPRVRDGERVATWCHGMCIPGELRSKLAILSNRILRDSCTEAGMRFVDVWRELEVDGYINPDFDLDGVHLRADATRHSLVAVARELGQARIRDVNPAQYELLAETDKEQRHGSAQPHQQHVGANYKRCSLAIAEITALRETLAYGPARSNPFAHPEWVGLHGDQIPDAQLVELGAEQLGRLHGLLCRPSSAAVLALGGGQPPGLCTLRVVRTLEPAAVAASQHLGAPVGTRRALLVLRGALGLQLKPAKGEPEALRLGEGDLITLDPAAVQLHCDSVAGKVELVEVGLIPRWGVSARSTHPATYAIGQFGSGRDQLAATATTGRARRASHSRGVSDSGFSPAASRCITSLR